jgi:hypothetical protein
MPRYDKQYLTLEQRAFENGRRVGALTIQRIIERRVEAAIGRGEVVPERVVQVLTGKAPVTASRMKPAKRTAAEKAIKTEASKKVAEKNRAPMSTKSGTRRAPARASVGIELAGVQGRRVLVADKRAKR